MAVANNLDRTISVFLGRGDGTFALSDTFGTSSGAFGVAFQIVTADFDNDGHTDLAAASEDNTVQVFYGHGDGTFDSGHIIAVVPTVGGLTTADFNGDGNADLAAISYPHVGSNTITVLLGDGHDSFTQNSLQSTGVSIVSGDFNSDGKARSGNHRLRSPGQR